MKLVVGSNNKGKIAEIKKILSPLGFEVVSQSEAGFNLEVEEIGTTFEENSALKARAIHRFCSESVIADDSGLEVDFLGKEPGVYSARYGGEGLDDHDRCMLVLDKLKGVAEKNRTARFVAVVTFISADGEEITVRGECEGIIGTEKLGENGFGYDPIFMVGDKSMAQITSDEKNKISHRGKALAKLVERLSE